MPKPFITRLWAGLCVKWSEREGATGEKRAVRKEKTKTQCVFLPRESQVTWHSGRVMMNRTSLFFPPSLSMSIFVPLYRELTAQGGESGLGVGRPVLNFNLRACKRFTGSQRKTVEGVPWFLRSHGLLTTLRLLAICDNGVRRNFKNLMCLFVSAW